MRIIPAITCRRLFATNVGPRNRSFGFADALQTTDEMSRAGCGVFSIEKILQCHAFDQMSVGWQDGEARDCQSHRHQSFCRSLQVILRDTLQNGDVHDLFTDPVSKLLLWYNFELFDNVPTPQFARRSAAALVPVGPTSPPQRFHSAVEALAHARRVRCCTHFSRDAYHLDCLF